MRRGNGVVLARALGCLWWDWEEHLSFFPRGSEFGWGGGQKGRGAGGSVAWWVMPGKVRLSVARAWGGQVRKTEKKKKSEKSQKVQLWPRAWPKLVHPSQCSAWVQSGPTCLHSEFNHQLCCTYSPAISPNSKIRKPPAPVPALHVCACACACPPSLLVTVTDRACACLYLKHPPPPPSLQAEFPTSSVSTILLTSCYLFFRLSSLALLNPLADLRGHCLSISSSAVPSTPSYLVITNSRRSIAQRDSTLENAVHTPTQTHAHALSHTVKMFATKALRQAAAHAERVPSIRFIGKRSIPCRSPPSACKSSRPPRHPFSKSQADLVMLRNSRRRPHPQASPCQPQPVSPQ